MEWINVNESMPVNVNGNVVNRLVICNIKEARTSSKNFRKKRSYNIVTTATYHKSSKIWHVHIVKAFGCTVRKLIDVHVEGTLLLDKQVTLLVTHWMNLPEILLSCEEKI